MDIWGEGGREGEGEGAGHSEEAADASSPALDPSWLCLPVVIFFVIIAHLSAESSAYLMMKEEARPHRGRAQVSSAG